MAEDRFGESLQDLRPGILHRAAVVPDLEVGQSSAGSGEPNVGRPGGGEVLADDGGDLPPPFRLVAHQPADEAYVVGGVEIDLKIEQGAKLGGVEELRPFDDDDLRWGEGRLSFKPGVADETIGRGQDRAAGLELEKMTSQKGVVAHRDVVEIEPCGIERGVRRHVTVVPVLAHEDGAAGTKRLNQGLGQGALS